MGDFNVEMANLLDSVENSVWHAFEFMALEGDGTVPKAKLKNLTLQIGKVLELEDVDNGLDDYRSTSNLTFEQYRYYLFKEVFSALPDEMPIEECHRLEAALDEVSWSFCSLNYKTRDNAVFPEECTYQLFRIFCMLADMVENDQGLIEVVMAAGEVENVAYQFMMNLGRGVEWDPEEFDAVAAVIPAFKFGIVVTVLESKYAKDVDAGGLREAVKDVHDFFLLDVVKKGNLGKKLDLVPAFKEYFCVLQPHRLSFYSGQSQREAKGEVKLDAQCRVESVKDSTSKSPIKSPGSKRHSKFKLFANEKTFEFQASDHRNRLQWLTGFRTAFENSSCEVRFQRANLEKRRIAREEEKERDEEDAIRSTDIGEQLENEKAARVNAEENAATLVRQRALDEKKMKELEAIRTQLEELLGEERQAKKDEEIVRTLQARILNEEWARRETLERLQEEQKSMLDHERKKREEFERQQNEKETQLRDAQKRVEEMERERRKLDRQLDVAQEKTKRANLGQEVLEAKMRVKECERAPPECGPSSRMNSLNPSASFYVRNRNGSNVNVAGGGGGGGGPTGTRGEGRSAYLPMRSASMRETSYSRSIRRRRNHAAGAGNGTLAPAGAGDTLSVNNDGIVVPAGHHGSSSHNVSTSAIAEVHTNGAGEIETES